MVRSTFGKKLYEHWVLRFSQAAGAKRAAPPAERGAEGAAAAEQQAAAAEGADLPAL